MVYAYNGILFGHRKEWNVICNNTDGSRVNYAKWNKSDREKQLLYDFTYVESKKTNKI